MGPLIRPGRPADTPELLRVTRAAILVGAARDYDARQRETWAAKVTLAGMERALQDDHVLVAELAGAVAGWTSIAGAELDMLYVDPACGGRGVGQALLAAADGVARALGLPGLEAHSSDRALGTFLAAGYQRVASERIELDGVPFTRTLVRKPL